MYIEKQPAGKRKIRYVLVAEPTLREEERPKPVPVTEQHALMVAALANTCKIAMATVSRAMEGQLNQAARILREAGASPEDVIVFSDYWQQAGK